MKRYVIEHTTDGFIASIYAEKFTLASKTCGHFWRGDDVVASIDTRCCTVRISGVRDTKKTTDDEIEAINLENAYIGTVMGY